MTSQLDWTTSFNDHSADTAGFIKKVVSASAGTGKTYQLSLEYINLLLAYHKSGVRFPEILVITFTRKATAEIRERIFEHLEMLVTGKDQDEKIKSSLQEILGRKITPKDIHILQSAYQDMLANKHQVQISTIDSFTNNIFKTIIAPYKGLTDYAIDPVLGDNLKEELYKTLLEEKENWHLFRSFFERSELKTIQSYENFVNDVIDRRWLFHLMKTSSRSINTDADNQAERALEKYRATLGAIFEEFHKDLLSGYADKTVEEVIKKKYYDAFVDDSNMPLSQCSEHLRKQLLSRDTLTFQHGFVLKETFWNGRTLFRKKLDKDRKDWYQDIWAKAGTFLADYLFYTLVLTEEQEIRLMVDRILNRYDELKFRERVFTHNDLLYYTFKFLYDPELSLIEQDSVTNVFYEHLAARYRFVLIDEFQDTSIVQFKALLPVIQEVISGSGLQDYGGVIVVGDEKQSIYGWRGGERDLLRHMPELLKNPQHKKLAMSYRSDENIIEFINSIYHSDDLQDYLTACDIHWPYSPNTAVKKNTQGQIGFFLRNYTTHDDEEMPNRLQAIREFVKDRIVHAIENGTVSEESTAVLARRNDDLNDIAAVLNEFGIACVLESSATILEHRIIVPLMHVLNYIVYQDVADLLRFLRSDYVLLQTFELKELLLTARDLKPNTNRQNLFEQTRHIPAVEKLEKVLDAVSHDSILVLVKRIIEEYNVNNIFHMESDIKNLNRFIEIVAHFLGTNRPYPNTLKGFLDYCHDFSDREEFKQVAIEEMQAIKLQTIHKSKGLEFKSVFLFVDINDTSSGRNRNLAIYYTYTDNFRALDNYVLTFNYKDIVKQSSYKELFEEWERRQAIEELNALYVAMTRAKTHLFIGCIIKGKNSISNLHSYQDDKIEIAKLMTNTLVKFFKKNECVLFQDDSKLIGLYGTADAHNVSASDIPKKDFSYLQDYIDFEREKYHKVDKEYQQRFAHIDFKSAFVEERGVEKGTIIHYYLSFIRHDTPEERGYARRQTLSRYGGLMPVRDIEILIAKADTFIVENPDIFPASGWRIFTEYTLFHPDGSQVRIDRLMVNTKECKIIIVDYKTGDIFEPDQLARYTATIESLPTVKQQDYEIDARFCRIEI